MVTFQVKKCPKCGCVYEKNSYMIVIHRRIIEQNAEG